MVMGIQQDYDDAEKVSHHPLLMYYCLKEDYRRVVPPMDPKVLANIMGGNNPRR